MADVFEAKRRCAERWLDQLIKRFQALENAGKCSIEGIEACGLSFEKEIHVFEGLDKLALYLRATTVFNPNWSAKYPDTGESYFFYKGWKIFTLWKKEVE